MNILSNALGRLLSILFFYEHLPRKIKLHSRTFAKSKITGLSLGKAGGAPKKRCSPPGPHRKKHLSPRPLFPLPLLVWFACSKEQASANQCRLPSDLTATGYPARVPRWLAHFGGVGHVGDRVDLPEAYGTRCRAVAAPQGVASLETEGRTGGGAVAFPALRPVGFRVSGKEKRAVHVGQFVRPAHEFPPETAWRGISSRGTGTGTHTAPEWVTIRGSIHPLRCQLQQIMSLLKNIICCIPDNPPPRDHRFTSRS